MKTAAFKDYSHFGQNLVPNAINIDKMQRLALACFHPGHIGVGNVKGKIGLMNLIQWTRLMTLAWLLCHPHRAGAKHLIHLHLG